MAKIKEWTEEQNRMANEAMDDIKRFEDYQTRKKRMKQQGITGHFDLMDGDDAYGFKREQKTGWLWNLAVVIAIAAFVAFLYMAMLFISLNGLQL